MPFFGKIRNCDMFVLLTECQFEKNGYQNRFRFDEQWYTMRVSHGLDPIRYKSYMQPHFDWERIKRTVPGGAALSIFDDCISGALVETNAAIIRTTCKLLGINTPIGADFPTTKRKTERLVEICQTYKATEYLSGPSGKGYLDMEAFDKAGIKIVFTENETADRRALVEVLGE
jgi:hypothetical protein